MTDQKPLYARLIRAHREHQLFLSQQGFADLITELARELDGIDLPCDQSSVSRWERGLDVPAYRFRKYVAKALGLDARDIFTEVAAQVRGVHHHQASQHGSTYMTLTKAPEFVQADRVTAHEPLEFRTFLRTDDGQGTPEYRAWMRRAKRRNR